MQQQAHVHLQDPSSMPANNNTTTNSNSNNCCAGCSMPIKDRFIFSVIEQNFHQDCVRCVDCSTSLAERCFTSEGKLYCRSDYWRRYGPKCSACQEPIKPTELVQRLRENLVYHLDCFVCQDCKRHLQAGEQLHLVEDKRLLCKRDYLASFGLTQAETSSLSLSSVAAPASVGGHNNVIAPAASPITTNAGTSPCPHLHNGRTLAGLMPANQENQEQVAVGSVDELEELEDPDELEEPDDLDELDEQSSPGDQDSPVGLNFGRQQIADDTKGAENQDELVVETNGKRRASRSAIKQPKHLETFRRAFESHIPSKPARHIREALAAETSLNILHNLQQQQQQPQQPQQQQLQQHHNNATSQQPPPPQSHLHNQQSLLQGHQHANHNLKHHHHSHNGGSTKSATSPASLGSGRHNSSSTGANNAASHKPTRVRTVLNEKQLQTLRDCYAHNPRPDALMKEQLVDLTGLSPRVIRVWFQNKRCKDKKKSILYKQMQQNEKDGRHLTSLMRGVHLVASSPVQYDDHSSVAANQAPGQQHSNLPQMLANEPAPGSPAGAPAPKQQFVQSPGGPAEIHAYQPPWKNLLEYAAPGAARDAASPRYQQLMGQIHGYSPARDQQQPTSNNSNAPRPSDALVELQRGQFQQPTYVTNPAEPLQLHLAHQASPALRQFHPAS